MELCLPCHDCHWGSCTRDDESYVPQGLLAGLASQSHLGRPFSWAVREDGGGPGESGSKAFIIRRYSEWAYAATGMKQVLETVLRCNPQSEV